MFTFEGTEVDLFADGTTSNTLTSTATVQSDGSRAIVIHGRYTQGRNQGPNRVLFGPGSAAYKGATGSYTYTEPSPPGQRRHRHLGQHDGLLTTNGPS